MGGTMTLIEHPVTDSAIWRARGEALLRRAILSAVVLLALAAQGSARAESAVGQAVTLPLLVEDAGLIGAITRWVDESAATIASHVKGARESIDGAAGRAGAVANEAANAVTRLPNTAVVTGRERCTAAANGAADCSVAIATLCRAKGFATGRILDIEASRKCPAEVLLSGRVPSLGDCGTESFVTRAMCQ